MVWVPRPKPGALQHPGLARTQGREGQTRPVGTELPRSSLWRQKCSAGTFLPLGFSQLPATLGAREGGSGGWDKGPCVDGCSGGGGHSLLGHVELRILCLRCHLPWSPISHAGCPQLAVLNTSSFFLPVASESKGLFFCQPPILPPLPPWASESPQFCVWETEPICATGPVLPVVPLPLGPPGQPSPRCFTEKMRVDTGRALRELRTAPFHAGRPWAHNLGNLRRGVSGPCAGGPDGPCKPPFS